MGIRILIVEDDVKIARLLELELNHAGYQVDCVYDGLSALRVLHEYDFELVLLDIMMPNLDGMEVINEIRKYHSELPVIMLSAKGQIQDKIKGLDHGANDYVTKPFVVEELLARIRVLLRNRKWNNTEQMGELLINYKEKSVMKNGKDIALTEKEYSLLSYFLRNRNAVLSREQILNAVWGFDFDGEIKIVDVYIGYLRKKLQQNQLVTIRGSGYQWKD
ncbi:response regulator transcription factor [Bacillus sp. UNCCL81]|uniref:response regulator transcription factor n=1 Tax=Bacillus sp. UNCCL81 TaxID=1502755 RepID=UPI0008E63C4E|nr:response regulator transcription factor [Bacillus sp. UNCCL81]SFC20917.1 DNA-binding response regulator, OmpR family, contains REC and winged-helix (wHTH) domain [Bacillus sp. UNCCL81]